MTFETRPGIEGAGRGKAQSLAQKGDLEQGAEAKAEQGRASEEDEDEDGRRQGLWVDPVDERGGAIGRQKFENARLRRRRITAASATQETQPSRSAAVVLRERRLREADLYRERTGLR